MSRHTTAEPTRYAWLMPECARHIAAGPARYAWLAPEYARQAMANVATIEEDLPLALRRDPQLSPEQAAVAVALMTCAACNATREEDEKAKGKAEE